jgi:hypothetical protein
MRPLRTPRRTTAPRRASRCAGRWWRTRGRLDAGMTTAEYAVGTLAAVAFAAVLLAVVKSGAVKSALTSIITTALGSAG